MLKGGIWYVVAAADGQVRTYRAHRVAEAADLGTTFERPAGFDLAAHWSETTAAYEGSAPRIEVTVRLDPRALPALEDAVGSRALREAIRLDSDGDPDGWHRVRLSLDWPDEAAGRLVALGNRIEVVDPPEVREAAIALTRGFLERHAVS